MHSQSDLKFNSLQNFANTCRCFIFFLCEIFYLTNVICNNLTKGAENSKYYLYLSLELQHF